MIECLAWTDSDLRFPTRGSRPTVRTPWPRHDRTEPTEPIEGVDLPFTGGPAASPRRVPRTDRPGHRRLDRRLRDRVARGLDRPAHPDPAVASAADRGVDRPWCDRWHRPDLGGQCGRLRHHLRRGGCGGDPGLPAHRRTVGPHHIPIRPPATLDRLRRRNFRHRAVRSRTPALAGRHRCVLGDGHRRVLRADGSADRDDLRPGAGRPAGSRFRLAGRPAGGGHHSRSGAGAVRRHQPAAGLPGDRGAAR